jgi:hypothetical protein
MSELYESVGFTNEYYKEACRFFEKYFETDDEMHQFFHKVFENDLIDKTPRRLMNQVTRWISLANDIDQIRPEIDPLRIVCIRACIESLCGLPKGDKKEKQKAFLKNNFSQEGKIYIVNSFSILSIEKNGYETAIDSSAMDEFENMIFGIRNNAVHDGDYWSTQVFSKQCGVDWISSYDIADKNTKIVFETRVEYDRFIQFFVEATINYINKYIEKIL